MGTEARQTWGEDDVITVSTHEWFSTGCLLGKARSHISASYHTSPQNSNIYEGVHINQIVEVRF